jgi:hypothetical protein
VNFLDIFHLGIIRNSNCPYSLLIFHQNLTDPPRLNTNASDSKFSGLQNAVGAPGSGLEALGELTGVDKNITNK